MADNTTLPGAGDVIAADDVGSVKYQRMKVTPGPDGTATVDVGGRTVDGGSTNSALYVDNRSSVVRLAVTPTVSTSPAYSLKDAVGGLMTFAGAVRASGDSCRLDSVQVVDKSDAHQDSALDLVLFDRTFTAPTDNAIFAPTDAEMATCVGVVPIGTWADFSVNSIACVNSVGLSIVLNGTSLFGALVARGTPTYTGTSDIIVTLTLVQD